MKCFGKVERRQRQNNTLIISSEHIRTNINIQKRHRMNIHFRKMNKYQGRGAGGCPEDSEQGVRSELSKGTLLFLEVFVFFPRRRSS